MNQFYLTTPIYYVNDRPHVGTAYSTITADVLIRYHRLFGDETYFLTGTDEHGQKCAQAAAARGLTPKAHCDDMVQNFKRAWSELHIDYDHFFRTTDEFHKTAVQAALQELFDKDQIYAAEYEGWYSVSDEIFYTDKEIVDGKSPTGKDVTRIREKNYFFKMSQYQTRLIDYIEQNPKFIQPDSRRNEVLGFLRQPLGDLCISRPKARMSWGIEFPFDADYVTYVWVDALLNYATAVGYQQPEKSEMFKKWWLEAKPHHLIGKDILTTHSVYWITLLMALDLPLPKQILAHGWILNKDLNKMSKSSGQTIDPLQLKDVVGAEGLRYFLVRDVHLGNDAPISQDLVIQRINNDLANNMGNLLSRTTNLLEKNFDSKMPNPVGEDEASQKLINSASSLAKKVEISIRDMNPSKALEDIFLVLSEANKYLEDQAPWKMVKTDLQGAGRVLSTAVEVLRIAAILLSPVMPFKMAELLKRLGVEKISFEDAHNFRVLHEGSPIVKPEPLFPRIEDKGIEK